MWGCKKELRRSGILRLRALDFPFPENGFIFRAPNHKLNHSITPSQHHFPHRDLSSLLFSPDQSPLCRDDKCLNLRENIRKWIVFRRRRNDLPSEILNVEGKGKVVWRMVAWSAESKLRRSEIFIENMWGCKKELRRSGILRLRALDFPFPENGFLFRAPNHKIQTTNHKQQDHFVTASLHTSRSLVAASLARSKPLCRDDKCLYLRENIRKWIVFRRRRNDLPSEILNVEGKGKVVWRMVAWERRIKAPEERNIYRKREVIKKELQRSGMVTVTSFLFPFSGCALRIFLFREKLKI